MRNKPLVLLALLSASVASLANWPRSFAEEKKRSVWEHRDALIRIDRSILKAAPKDDAGSAVEANPGQPFTYEEQVYNRPRREWWWSAARYTVIFAGGAVLTYVSAGLLAPWVGGAIGGLSGLTGAAAVSQGLAFLGGGAIAAGGFGMAGGTAVVGLITDLAVSAALEYSLRPVNQEKRFEGLNDAIRHLDANQKEPAAWVALERAALGAASCGEDYVVVCHAVASAYLRWAADENISRVLEEEKITEAETTVSQRQRLLMTAAIRLLEEARTLEPRSSLIHHSLGNAYWWLSVRGGPGKVEDSGLPIPSTSKLYIGAKDETACFKAALWHYSVGSACEPRNTHIRSNWAMALQADGTLHEAIAVVAGGLPHLSECRAADQAALLRTSAMLEYQAFSRSPLANRSEQEGGPPSIDDAPMLMAAMQAYSKAVGLDQTDLSSLTSLLQIYRTFPQGSLKATPHVMTLEEVQFRFTEAVLTQEKSLASLPTDKKPSTYKPGQILSHYRELLRWCFDGLGASDLDGKHLARLFKTIDAWIVYSQQQGIKERPFSRDLALRVHSACKQYNDTDSLASLRGYSLKVLDSELSRKPEDP